MSVNKTTDVIERRAERRGGEGGRVNWRGKTLSNIITLFAFCWNWNQPCPEICLSCLRPPSLPSASARLVKFSFSCFFIFCVFQLVFWFYLTWLLVVLLLVLQAATLRRRLIATVEKRHSKRGEGGSYVALCALSALWWQLLNFHYIP